jgi:hypothetical protein
MKPTKMTPEAKKIFEQITEEQRRDFKSRLDQTIKKFFEDNNLPQQMADSIEVDLDQWYKEDDR